MGSGLSTLGTEQQTARSARVLLPLLVAAFCLAELLLFRIGTDSGMSLAGVFDDLFLLLATLTLLAAARRLLGAAGLLIAVPWLGFITIATVANNLYFKTFHTWISLNMLFQTNEVSNVRSSIAGLMTVRMVLVGFLVPLAMVGLVVRYWSGWRTPRLSVLAPVTVLFGLLPGFMRSPGVATNQNNFLVAAFRHAASRAALQFGPYSPDAVLAGTPVTQLVPSTGGYSRGGDPEHPLLQLPIEPAVGPARRPNVIVIEAESFRAAESGTYGAKVSLTPEFDALAKEGLVARRFYAAGIQTTRGEMAILCSMWPALGSAALYKRAPDTKLTCLPELLRSYGWDTYWFSGFSADYANGARFLTGHGVSHVLGEESMSRPGDEKLGWGISDTEMAERVLEQLDHARGPFFATWLTLSGHHPFDWDYPIEFPEHLARKPGESVYDAYRRGLFYTDHVIGEFVRKVRQRPWGRDAWIVITGDHGMYIFPEDDTRSELQKLEAHFRLPFLLLAPGVLNSSVVARPASQIDVAPTLLELLGARAPNAFVGQSMLRPPDAPASPILLVAENAASVIADHQRCMVSQVTCYLKAQPLCAEGEEPVSASHVCFEMTGDLLDAQLPALNTLAAEASFRLGERGAQLARLQTYLEGHDRLGGGEPWREAIQAGAAAGAQGGPQPAAAPSSRDLANPASAGQ